MSFSIGQSVSFGRPNGEKTSGTIEKINAKSVVVRLSEARGRWSVGSIWNVNPEYVTALNDVKSTPQAPASTPVNDDALWNRYASYFGLPLNLLGNTVKVKGVEYRVTGLNPRRPKFPVNCARVCDGHLFKLTVKCVVDAFKTA